MSYQYKNEQACYEYKLHIKGLLDSVYEIENCSDMTKKLNEKIILYDAGINSVTFQINNNKLYRVFNNSTFYQGGRFFGAEHIGLPKQIRKSCLKWCWGR